MSEYRFSRPSYSSRASVDNGFVARAYSSTQITNNQQTNKLTDNQNYFSTPKIVEERKLFKPFGKAVDSVQNKNITTYGEDVYIEYNPAIFIGNSGILRADTYLKNVVAAYSKNEPLAEIILLKPEFDSTNTTAQNESLIEKYDWWADETINKKIIDNKLNNTIDKNNQQISVRELIPEALDKITIANTLIRTLQISTNRDVAATVNFRNMTQQQARFAPVKRATSDIQIQQNLDFDDNYSIRISNFTNPDDLTSYAIRDVLNEFIGDIKYKASIPRNKETNKNKDFAFINFVTEDDMKRAFALLTAQRIFMDSAILHVELGKQKIR